MREVTTPTVKVSCLRVADERLVVGQPEGEEVTLEIDEGDAERPGCGGRPG